MDVLDYIVEFVFSGNKIWKDLHLTKEQLKEYLKKPWVHLSIIKDKDLQGVAIYLKNKVCVHFISVTVNDKQGSKVIRKIIGNVIQKEKPKFYSWLNPEYRIIAKETKCLGQYQ